MRTLYERLGGEAAVKSAVAIFYNRILSDARTAPFFAGIDMERQAAKQRALLTLVFGGPDSYNGRSMREAHAPLLDRGLNDSHVDAVIEILAGTLREMGAAESDIREVEAIAESMRDDVLGR